MYLLAMPGIYFFLKPMTGNRYIYPHWYRGSTFLQAYTFFLESHDTKESGKSPGDSVQMQTHFFPSTCSLLITP